MADDLVKRLRKENALAGYYGPPAIQVEAADRIAALEAALRELLHQLDTDDVGGLVEGAMAAAARALKGKPHD